jgi:hypothetical protein
LFGRLLYLASLHNPANGAYEHAGLAQMVGREQAREVLRRSHARVFQDWLCLRLEQQKSDLGEYLAEAPNPSALLDDWAASAVCQSWAPPTAQDVEMRLFVGDLQILFAMLRREYGVPAQGHDPES